MDGIPWSRSNWRQIFSNLAKLILNALYVLLLFFQSVISETPFYGSSPWENQLVNSSTISSTEYSLFPLPKLSYTRGTVVPLFLSLESEDEQALELLASPKAIIARVRRRIRDHVHPENHFESSVWRDSLDYSQRAVWWPSDPKGDSGTLRSLQGEIHLKPGMRPTTALGAFAIEVWILISPHVR
jgi:hypothetical protein